MNKFLPKPDHYPDWKAWGNKLIAKLVEPEPKATPEYILTSPNGTKFKLIVDDTGTLTTEEQ